MSYDPNNLLKTAVGLTGGFVAAGVILDQNLIDSILVAITIVAIMFGSILVIQRFERRHS